MDSIANFYNNLAERYGTGFQSADAQSEKSLVARYKVLSEVADLNGLDVLEVGCGTGGLGVYLKNKYPDIRYTGIDVAGSAIKVGKKAHPELDLRWTALNDASLLDKYDCVLAQGILYKLPYTQRRHHAAEQVLDKMISLSKRIIAFTAIDSWGKQRGDEWRINPVVMLEFLKNYTTNIVFRHDYQYDSCFYLYKGGQ